MSCSTFLPAFDDVSVLDLGHSHRCVVVAHCCFNLDISCDVEHPFIWYNTICVSFFLVRHLFRTFPGI